MPDGFALVEVGCLECGEATVYRGRFGTIDEARAATVELGNGREEVVVLRRDEVIEDGWRGQCVFVIIDLGQ